MPSADDRAARRHTAPPGGGGGRRRDDDGSGGDGGGDGDTRLRRLRRGSRETGGDRRVASSVRPASPCEERVGAGREEKVVRLHFVCKVVLFR